MKKALGVIFAFFFLVGAAFFNTAYAATVNTPTNHKMPELTMTDQQKSEMISLKIQILELKKKIIKQNVEKGTLTQEQGKGMEEKINARLERLKSGHLDPGFGRHRPPGCKQPQAPKQ